MLIQNAQKHRHNDPPALPLGQAAYALDSTVVDFCMSLFQAIAWVVLFLLLPPAALSGSDDELASAQSARKEADALFTAGKYNDAIISYLESLSRYEKLGLVNDVAVVRHQLGFSYLGANQKADALREFEANLAWHRQQGHRDSVANYLLYAAQLYIDGGEYDRALKYLVESDGLVAHQPARRADVAHWRIVALEKQGNIEGARKLVRTLVHDLPEEVWRQYLNFDVQRLIGDPHAETESSELINPLALAVGIATYLLLMAWLSRYPRARPWLVNSTLALVSVSATFAIAEFALRITTPPLPVVLHLLHTPNQTTKFVPHRGIMPGVTYETSNFTTNAAGLRGDPVPNDQRLRILAIGGSSTEALFLDDKDAWPHVMQEELTAKLGRPVWVGNAGKSGLNTFSHATQFYFQLPELQPKIAVVTAGINDLNQCISGGLQAVRDNASAIRKEHYFDGYQQHVFQQVLTDRPDLRWRVTQLIDKAWQRWVEPPRTIQFDHAVQDEAGAFYIGQRLRRINAAKLDTPPDISECVNAFSYNLKLIAAMARKNHVTLLFVTQGSLYRADLTPDEEELLWFGAKDANPFGEKPPAEYYTAAAMAQMLGEYNRATINVCAAEHVACWITDEHVPKTTESYYDDVHLNIQGSRTLGKSLAAFLARIIRGDAAP